MNRIALLTLALAAAGVSAAAFAQSGHDHGKRHDHARGEHRQGHGIVQLDVDQDGRIARGELTGEGRHVAIAPSGSSGVANAMRNALPKPTSTRTAS